jgi:hypothetical protein
MDMRDYCTDFSRCPKELKDRADANAAFNIQDVMRVVNRCGQLHFLETLFSNVQ